MTSKEDVLKYPVYQYINGTLVKLRIPPSNYNVFEWQIHHYIEQQYIRLHPDKYAEIEHLQKLFILPPDMHAELHAGTRKFKEKWGIDRKELLYKLRGEE